MSRVLCGLMGNLCSHLLGLTPFPTTRADGFVRTETGGLSQVISDHASLKCDLEDWFTFHLGGWGSYLARLGTVGLEGLHTGLDLFSGRSDCVREDTVSRRL